MDTPHLPQFSVVVPFYNEEAAVDPVVDELAAALAAAGLDWEAVLVDDGSRDSSPQRLAEAARRHPRARTLFLQRNLGQGIALHRGLRAARAPILGMMDGDGQNVPADFARLLPLLDKADLINGVRARRDDSRLRLRLSRLANSVRRRLLGDGLTDAGCAIKVFRREVADGFWPFPMLNPFMGALARNSGFRVAECPVAHRPRSSGTSKYSLRVTAWRPFLDLLAVWWLTRRRPTQPVEPQPRA